ncbi:MAG: hypothetical protein D6812_12240 [Deltaproteobacteria bacterium]|nr:MAG: hypothetical protein D6812_12240 [Deltaproteobacteria bacterium]
MKAYPPPDQFLQEVIREYYVKEAHSPKGKLNFLILLFASGEMIPTLQSYLDDVSTEKKLLSSAISIVALRLLLRRLLAGPFGIVISGLGLASLVSLAYRKRETIALTVGEFRNQVELLKLSYESLLNKHRNGELNDHDFELMVEGLKSRFFATLAATDLSQSAS